MGAQPDFRGTGAPIREPAAAPVGASWTDRLPLKQVPGTLAAAAAVAVLLSLLGPFGDRRRFLINGLLALIFCLSGSMLGLFTAWGVARSPLGRRGPIVLGVATGLFMAPGMLVVVWTADTLLLPPAVAARALGAPMIWRVALISVAFSIVATAMNRRRPTSAAPQSELAAAPRFIERLPLRLRDAELWAVEAEDHYLRVHTSGGQDLILLRMADALAELQGVDGVQVHRSWWVARQGVADARRVDRRATVTLRDGTKVPVSRTFTRELKGLGWL